MANAVVYVIDQRGYELARHSAMSMMVSKSDFADIYLFCHNFLPPLPDPLIAIGKGLGKTVCIESITNAETDALSLSSKNIPTTAYLKLDAVDKIVSRYDAVLYLDHDVLVFDDFDVSKDSLDGYPVGAVYDIAEVGGLNDPDFISNCVTHGLSPHYFNSGVMLFDCSQWDSASFRADYMRFLTSHQHSCGYKRHCGTSDQCCANRLFARNWKRLPLKYNTQACARFTDIWKEAAVRHFQGIHKFLPNRPWRNDRRDMRLLNFIRPLMGLPKLIAPPTDLIFELNAIRNGRNEAIAAIGKAKAMLDAPLSDDRPSPNHSHGDHAVRGIAGVA